MAEAPFTIIPVSVIHHPSFEKQGESFLKICAFGAQSHLLRPLFSSFLSDGFFFQLIPMFKSLLPYNPSLALDFTFPLKNSSLRLLL